MAKAKANKKSSRPVQKNPAPKRGLKQYPRPMLHREGWINLNGQWDFAMDTDASLLSPKQVSFDRTIEVPFAPETPASGIADTGFYKAVWYRRTFNAPPLPVGHRLILYFGAVDDTATVWVNGQRAIEHQGGYAPFHVDITDMLQGTGEQTIVVRAFDDPADLSKPRGKQDWLLDAHSIWYPRTTGIWQTVWMEVVPAASIDYLRWTADVDSWSIRLDATVAGTVPNGARLRVVLSSHGNALASDEYAITTGAVSRTINLPDPGNDDPRIALLWSPQFPNLIDATLTLLDSDGQPIDTVSSYTAMRSVSIERDRFCLNARPYKLVMALDQGYWPESGLSSPDDDALRADVELLKQMGFNGVRKHQKIEDPRFLYWADQLGLLVWEEMPSAYTFCQKSIERLSQQWVEAIHRDVSHPCIVAWVPFNESWGVPELPTQQPRRNLVAGMYALTKALDTTRPCIGNDGWEACPHSSDIIGIHDYDADPARMAIRYAFDEPSIEHLLNRLMPGNKAILLDGFEYDNQPMMLTEFGGIAFSKDLAHTWGYSRAGSSETFALRYYRLMDVIRQLPLFGGSCYTQFTDTYQEANGLLYMDRTPKFPIEQIAVATRGAHSDGDHAIEKKWREAK